MLTSLEPEALEPDAPYSWERPVSVRVSTALVFERLAHPWALCHPDDSRCTMLPYGPMVASQGALFLYQHCGAGGPNRFFGPLSSGHVNAFAGALSLAGEQAFHGCWFYRLIAPDGTVVDGTMEVSAVNSRLVISSANLSSRERIVLEPRISERLTYESNEARCSVPGCTEDHLYKINSLRNKFSGAFGNLRNLIARRLGPDFTSHWNRNLDARMMLDCVSGGSRPF